MKENRQNCLHKPEKWRKERASTASKARWAKMTPEDRTKHGAMLAASRKAKG